MPSVIGTRHNSPAAHRSVRDRITELLGLRTGLGRHAFDQLEGRKLLSIAPPPPISDLANANDPVVRIETNYGVVDIELFIDDAPSTVANFLNYVTSERYDTTFFHRSVTSPLFVLQGGGFTFSNATGVAAIDTDDPIALESTGRSNLARTVAMARTGSPDSATSQFFINYVDNTSLDPTGPGTGYAVFGQVVNGWDSVLAIQALPPTNLQGDPKITGRPEAGAMGEVPVGPSYNSANGVQEADLVTIIDAEIFKPAGDRGFYTNQVVFPEGFRSGRTIESLDLLNPNGVTASYQVIARYENGDRDQVVTAGTLNANTSLHVRLSDFTDASLTTMRLGVPYALVVESTVSPNATNPLPIAASINRQDFNAATGEGFFNPAGYSDNDLMVWDVPRIERADLSQEFLLWQSLSGQTATVTVTFTTDSGPVVFTRDVAAYRRGGLEVHSLSLPLGVLSARITSTQPLAVALSDWDLPIDTTAPAGDAGFYTPGFGSLGIPAGGSTNGGLSDLTLTAGWTNVVSISNPGGSVAVVTFKFWRDSRGPTEDPVTRTVILSPGTRNDFVLDSSLLGIPEGERFAATYSSGITPVAIGYTAVEEVQRHEQLATHNDGVQTSFLSQLGPSVFLTDGQWDPDRDTATQDEAVSIFNPFASPTAQLSYTVRFSFSDGTVIDATSGTLTSNARVLVRTGDFANVLAKIGSDPAFRHYAISVVGTISDPDNAINQAHAGLVSMSRFDSLLGRSITTTGMPSALGISMSDPILLPDGGAGG